MGFHKTTFDVQVLMQTLKEDIFTYIFNNFSLRLNFFVTISSFIESESCLQFRCRKGYYSAAAALDSHPNEVPKLYRRKKTIFIQTQLCNFPVFSAISDLFSKP